MQTLLAIAAIIAVYGRVTQQSKYEPLLVADIRTSFKLEIALARFARKM